MIIKNLRVSGGFSEKTNCYIIFDEMSKETIVVDPAGEIEIIANELDVLGGNIKYIYLTHCHGDHTSGVNELKTKKGGEVVIHEDDKEGLSDDGIHLSSYMGMKDPCVEADFTVKENEVLKLGQNEIKIIHTPGHTRGGSCLYNKEDKFLISGDTMFKGTWGRTDLPTSNLRAIMDSISSKLLTLPEDTVVYPGHGEKTYIKEEIGVYNT